MPKPSDLMKYNSLLGSLRLRATGGGSSPQALNPSSNPIHGGVKGINVRNTFIEFEASGLGQCCRGHDCRVSDKHAKRMEDHTEATRGG